MRPPERKRTVLVVKRSCVPGGSRPFTVPLAYRITNE